jgi:ubiquinone/menaquinone biosynthesis C-methylase UbiE
VPLQNRQGIWVKLYKEESMAGTSYKEGWGAIDQAAEPGEFVRFMDRVNGDDSEDTFLRLSETIRKLEVQPGHHVLEVGCGTGGAARALAGLAGPEGWVVAVDLSETMLKEAKARGGTVANLEFIKADAHALPFAGGSFDRCCARNVLEIVTDPSQAMSEMARVLRPGGKLVLPAADYGSLTIQASDRDLTRTIITYISDQETNGWVGRELPSLFLRAGLADLTISVEASVCNDFPYFFESWLGPYLSRALAAGVVTEEQITPWLNEQGEHARANIFFSVHTTFTVAGWKR